MSLSKHEPKIYRQGRALKITLKILLWVFIVLLLFAVAAFFGFRRYIAYTPRGELYLDIPWLYGYMNEPDMSPPEETETDEPGLPVFYPAILENRGDYRHVHTVPQLSAPSSANPEGGENTQDSDIQPPGQT